MGHAHTDYYLAVATILPVLLIAVGLQLPVSEWTPEEPTVLSLTLVTVVLALVVGEFAALEDLYTGRESRWDVFIVAAALSWSFLAIVARPAVLRASVLLGKLPRRVAAGVGWGLTLAVGGAGWSDALFGTHLLLALAVSVVFVLVGLTAFQGWRHERRAPEADATADGPESE